MKIELDIDEVEVTKLVLYATIDNRKASIKYYQGTGNNYENIIKVLNNSIQNLNKIIRKLETAAQEAT